MIFNEEIYNRTEALKRAGRYEEKALESKKGIIKGVYKGKREKLRKWP